MHIIQDITFAQQTWSNPLDFQGMWKGKKKPTSALKSKAIMDLREHMCACICVSVCSISPGLRRLGFCLSIKMCFYMNRGTQQWSGYLDLCTLPLHKIQRKKERYFSFS